MAIWSTTNGMCQRRHDFVRKNTIFDLAILQTIQQCLVYTRDLTHKGIS